MEIHIEMNKENIEVLDEILRHLEGNLASNRNHEYGGEYAQSLDDLYHETKVFHDFINMYSVLIGKIKRK